MKVLGIRFLNQHGLRRGLRSNHFQAGSLKRSFVIGCHHDLGPILGDPSEGCVADNGEKPRARIGIADRRDRSEGTYAGFLHDILGIGAITREPTRQSQGVVNVGQHHFRKSLLVVHAASRGHYLTRMNVQSQSS
ncbi:hypothetical protein HYPGJ_20170 [Hyphomicrobium sp. GJ21]|nr:hypothetical protein HYPGJ_20170 [Hyphomicrobium sp. GJ21]